MTKTPSPGLVFVGGAPRSGTTLVRRMLGAHPEIYAQPEFDIVASLVGLREVAHLLRKGFEALKAAPDRVLAVHYDDLVTDPEGESRRLCDFLGLPFAREMLRVEEVRFDRSEGEAARRVNAWYTEAGLVARPAPRHPRLARYGLEAAPQPPATHLLRARFKAERSLRRLGRALTRRLPT